MGPSVGVDALRCCQDSNHGRPASSLITILTELPRFFSAGFYSPYLRILALMDFSIHRHLLGLLGWGISPTQSYHDYALKYCNTNMKLCKFEYLYGATIRRTVIRKAQKEII
jgi:hypothetical protein